MKVELEIGNGSGSCRMAWTRLRLFVLRFLE